MPKHGLGTFHDSHLDSQKFRDNMCRLQVVQSHVHGVSSCVLFFPGIKYNDLVFLTVFLMRALPFGLSRISNMPSVPPKSFAARWSPLPEVCPLRLLPGLNKNSSNEYFLWFTRRIRHYGRSWAGWRQWTNSSTSPPRILRPK